MNKIQNNPLTDKGVFEKFRMLKNIFYEYLKIYNENKINIPPLVSAIKCEDYSSHLGLSLMRHGDIESFMIKFLTSLFDYCIEKGDDKRLKEELKEKNNFLDYENARIGLAFISYLSTGDKKFLISINANEAPHLIEKLIGGKLNCVYDLSDTQTVLSDQSFSAYQHLKNAINKEATKLEVILREESKYQVLKVKDNGAGMPQEKFPTLFSSERVGLRVVKRILDLREGYAEVTSTEPGKDTFKYDTKSDIVQKIAEHQPQGTSFMLYFPKA